MTENINNEIISESNQTKIITAYGDSLTAGYGLSIEESYPSLLQKKLIKEGYKYKVVNAGLSGDTTQAGLSRINWVLKTNPEIVILELGANDALRGMSTDNARKNLEKIITTLQSKKIKILLAGMHAPRNLGEKYYKSFDSIYPELSKKYKVPLIPFFLDGVALDKNLNIGDGVHPNAKGYIKILENNVWKYIKPILQK
ncbi:MAG: arylesterase [Candidatus Sericytochromatia bacterium]